MIRFVSKEKRESDFWKTGTRLLGSALALAAIVWLVVEMIGEWSKLPKLTWNLEIIGLVICIVSGATGCVFLAGRAYQVLVLGFGGPKSHPGCLIYVFCQLLKYLPGNVFHLVGRIGLSVRGGLEATRATGALVVEVLLMVTASSLLTVPMLMSAIMGSNNNGVSVFENLVENPQMMGFVGIGILVFVVAIVFLPNMINRTFRFFRGKEPFGERSEINRGAFCRAFGYYLLYFVVMGLLFWFTGWGVFGMRGSVAVFTGVFATSWVLGMVTPGAPGGVGIREAIIVGMLAPTLGKPGALSLALFFRVITLFADGIGGLVAFFWWRATKKADSKLC